MEISKEQIQSIHNLRIGIIRVLADAAFNYKKKELFGGDGWETTSLEAVYKNYGLTLKPEDKQIARDFLHDLSRVEETTPRNPYVRGTPLYYEALEARKRVPQFISGEISVYRKKRYKSDPTKKKHRKHHPDSPEICRGTPWNAFKRKVRAGLSAAENKHTLDDSLYCCWEENWYIKETIDECKEAFEAGTDVRK